MWTIHDVARHGSLHRAKAVFRCAGEDVAPEAACALAEHGDHLQKAPTSFPMTYADIQKPALPYRYEFGLDELEAAQACVDAHGFAVVKQVLSAELVKSFRNRFYRLLTRTGHWATARATPTPPLSNTPLHCGNCSTTSPICGSSGSSARRTSSPSTAQPRFCAIPVRRRSRGTLTGTASVKAPRKMPAMS